MEMQKFNSSQADVMIKSVILASLLIGGSITKIMAFNDLIFLGKIYIHDLVLDLGHGKPTAPRDFPPELMMGTPWVIECD